MFSPVSGDVVILICSSCRSNYASFTKLINASQEVRVNLTLNGPDENSDLSDVAVSAVLTLPVPAGA